MISCLKTSMTSFKHLNLDLHSIIFQNAPNPKKVTKDLYDLNGSSPYKTTEIAPGKLWEIIYSFENSGRIDIDKKKEVRANFGMDPK